MTRRKKTHKEYEQELFEGEIDYFPIEEYVKYKTPIIHECLYGHQWKTSPSNILSGSGCPSCYGNTKHNMNSYKKELVHRGITKYIPVEEYINAATPISHLCKVCNHIWKVNTYSILRGCGCPKCSKHGFDRTLPAILYFISFLHNDVKYYKVGVTNNSISKRFKASERTKLNIIQEWELQFDIGSGAIELESLLLSQYKDYLVNTGALSSGNTETLLIPIPRPKIVIDK